MHMCDQCIPTGIGIDTHACREHARPSLLCPSPISTILPLSPASPASPDGTTTEVRGKGSSGGQGRMKYVSRTGANGQQAISIEIGAGGLGPALVDLLLPENVQQLPAVGALLVLFLSWLPTVCLLALCWCCCGGGGKAAGQQPQQSARQYREYTTPGGRTAQVGANVPDEVLRNLTKDL